MDTGDVWDSITKHAIQLDLSNYVRENRCHTVQEFLGSILCDIRCGKVMAQRMYEKFFSDDKFRHYVEFYCDYLGHY